MVENEISQNIEEYLEVLYRNGNNKEQISTTQLSKFLKIAPGSVTQMLKKMEKLGYIEYVPYQGAVLTDKGMKIAQKITRKHRIIETFLINVLNIKKENVHKQACDMEHSLYDEAERALCIHLGIPDSCPEGVVVPACIFDFEKCKDCINELDYDNVNFRETSLLSLSELKKDLSGEICFIRGNEEIFKEITDLGIDIGSEIFFFIDGQKKDLIRFILEDKSIDIPVRLANNIFIEI